MLDSLEIIGFDPQEDAENIDSIIKNQYTTQEADYRTNPDSNLNEDESSNESEKIKSTSVKKEIEDKSNVNVNDKKELKIIDHKLVDIANFEGASNKMHTLEYNLQRQEFEFKHIGPEY